MKEQRQDKQGTAWMFLPVALLLSTVVGWLVMVSIAVDDPGFAVEPDYYKKASNYDATVAQRRENARLGFQLKVTGFEPDDASGQLTVLALNRDGQPLQGAIIQADAFPVARASQIQKLQFSNLENGLQQALVHRPRIGLWEIRFKVSVGGDVFTEILRTEFFRDSSERGETPS